jgi:hypothetical protein
MDFDTVEFQNALAQVLVDQGARQQLRTAPEAFRQRFGLDQRALQALQHPGLDQLRGFANDLATKRVEIFAKMCPNTFALLRRYALLDAVASRFIAECAPLASSEFPNRVVKDFFTFTALVADLIRRGEVSGPFLADVVACERLQGRLSTTAASLQSARRYQTEGLPLRELPAQEVLARRPRLADHAALTTFSCDLPPVMRCLTEERPLPPDEPRPTTLLLIKVPGWRRVQTVSVNPLARELLTLCDGTRATTAIAAALGGTTDGCVRAIQAMVRQTALWLDTAAPN